MSLVGVRVDDRLVHGQVVLAWGRALSLSRLLVADDAVASNDWERELMSTLAEDLEVEVLAVAEAPARMAAEETRPGAALLLLRSPAAALAACEAGAPIRELNLGGLHFAGGKERVLDYIYLDDADRAALRELEARGVHLTAQDVPATRPIEVSELLRDDGGES